MIILLGTVDVAPEDRARFLEDSQPKVAASRGDAGCVGFTIAADSSDPGRVHFVEVWATREDLDAHGAASERRNLPESDVPRLASEFLVYPAGEPTPL